MKPMRIAIIGLGLIGGSLARALATQGYEISAVDKDAEALSLGLKLEAAAHVNQDLLQGIAGAKLIIIAVPVGAAQKVLRAIAPNLVAGTIVTDVGSVKTGLMQLAETTLPVGVDFIGGHPMAGTEQTGMAGANPDLFKNAFYVLTPGSACSPKSVEIVTQLVQAVGAVPVIMDSVKHDRAVATLSHLPHLLAVALAQTAGSLESEQPGSLNLASGSFRDGTRVAESNPVMWEEVCLENKSMILSSLQTFRTMIDKLEGAIERADGIAIRKEFSAGGEVRAKYSSQVKGKLADLVELVVRVPNSPGALATVTRALGESNINIANIEVLRVQHGAQGGIILGIQGEDSASNALSLIQQLGIEVTLVDRETSLKDC